MRTARLANFFIVGVQKAGTTSLHDYLAAHPQIAAAEPKEPAFFVKHGNHGAQQCLLAGVTALTDQPYASSEEYAGVFGRSTAPWRLDSSTPYFQSDFAREQIQTLVPEARIVVCLREPVARAYSAYNWARKEGWETAASFEEALALEARRKAAGFWFSYLYADTSRYGSRLEAWLAAFPNCKVVFFDDLKKAPLATVNDILSWLGLEPLTALAAPVRNPSGVDRRPLARALRGLVNRSRNERGALLRAVNAAIGNDFARRLKRTALERLDRDLVPPAPLETATWASLQPLFADDVRHVEMLVDRDLSSWRVPPSPPDRRNQSLDGSNP